MTILEKWLFVLGVSLLALAGIFECGRLSASAKYEAQIASIQAAQKQALADSEAEKARLLSQYAQAAQEVNQDAQKTIGDQSALIGKLRNATPTIRLCSSAEVSREPVPAPNGPGATAGDRPTASGPSTDPEIAIDADSLDTGLGIAIDALKAEQLNRQWLRGTGQL